MRLPAEAGRQLQPREHNIPGLPGDFSGVYGSPEYVRRNARNVRITS